MRISRLWKVLLSFFLVISILLLLPAAALANTIDYWKTYNLNGRILMKILYGSETEGTGYHKSLIQGAGSLQREEFNSISGSELSVENWSSWTAGSLRGLEVASAFGIHPDAEEGSAAAESDQVFAVSAKANRGESGTLEQGITAVGEGDIDFSIEQSVEVTDGTVMRHIDFVDPESGSQIFEDSKIVGYALITDALRTVEEETEGLWEALIFSQEGGEGEQTLIVLNGDERFSATYPVGTPLDEVMVPETITVTVGFTSISGVAVAWQPDSEPPYNPDQPGSYMFWGELVFPENITVTDPVLVRYTVYLAEELPE
ncbi:MAG TPA: hypothetical protein ENN91_06220 [Firmicutes bacterium]|nr:hypothetical protein [Bacillota bacterium]